MNDSKLCKRCGLIKLLSDFYTDKRGVFGVRSTCKKCCIEVSNSSPNRAINVRRYWLNNQASVRGSQKERYHNNIEGSRKYHREKMKRLRMHNPTYRAKSSAATLRRYYKLKNDPIFLLRKTLRSRFLRAIKKEYKKTSCIKLLGCSIPELRRHIQSKFKEGMSWDNHGIHGWHIDHIIPCNRFDLSRLDEQKKCFHFSNLQPLWASENLEKSDSISQSS